MIVTTDDAGNVLSQSHYETYGEHTDYGAMPSDKHRANTKVEDADTSLLLEGHRYRLIGAGIFLSPDPLEYVDGLHRYAYCGFNPWGRFDPTGLSFCGYDSFGDYFRDVGKVWKGYGLAVKDTAVGIYHMQTNPLGTAMGLANAAMNPIETGKAIVNNVSDTWNSGPEGQGRIVGHILIGVALAAAPAAEGANAVKAGMVVDAAGNSAKTTQVARVGEAAEATAQAGAKVGNVADKLPVNPFKGKTNEEIAKMFERKGFTARGPEPLSGKGDWLNDKTGRSFHIDRKNSFNERPHVDVNRPKNIKGANGERMEKKKIFIEGE